jgi:acetolactate synthase I/II/III large subunit
MNIQELATLSEPALPVTILVMNNGHLGLVRQYGIRGYRVAEGDSLPALLAEALSHTGPCIIDIPIDAAENVYLIVPSGARNTEMMEGA